MNSHALDDNDEIRDLIKEFAAQLGYLQLDREAPRNGRVGRFEWDVPTAQDRGLLATDATADDLVDAAMEWLESSVSADAPPGQRAKYRLRLSQPGGHWVKQRVVHATPEEAAEANPFDGPIAALPPLEGAAAIAMQTILEEQRRGWKELNNGWKDFATMLMREATEGRRNTSRLFDAHVGREMAVVNAERARLEADRDRAAEAEEPTLIDGIASMATKLWAVQNDLPPDLVEMVANDDQLRHLLARPGLAGKLKDPAVQALLRNLAEAGT